MKEVLLYLCLLFSFTLFGQDNNGILKSKLYIDSSANLSKDTFEIVIYNSTNEQLVSRSLECEKVSLSLPAGMYSMRCMNKNGVSITIENVRISYNSISFYDVNVCSLSEREK